MNPEGKHQVQLDMCINHLINRSLSCESSFLFRERYQGQVTKISITIPQKTQSTTSLADSVSVMFDINLKSETR